MGYAERANRMAKEAAAAAEARRRSRCSGLRVAVDVQHLHRDPPHAADQGTVFVLADGSTITEGHAATIYAQAIAATLKGYGAQVLENSPGTFPNGAPAGNAMLGPYTRRQREAKNWGAHAYLACHVNAGHGAYALFEYLAGSMGSRLALAIGNEFPYRFPGVIAMAKESPLAHGQRGYVCLEGMNGPDDAAVLCEPFFGDFNGHQRLFAAPELKAIGEAIAEGVALWWQRRAGAPSA